MIKIKRKRTKSKLLGQRTNYSLIECDLCKEKIIMHTLPSQQHKTIDKLIDKYKWDYGTVGVDNSIRAR